MNSSATFSLFSQPYLDKKNQCYINIVTINVLPKGPLSKLVRKINFPRLSEFQQSGPCSPIKNCGLALTSFGSCCCGDLMVVDEVPNLISYLASNGYKIDTSVTKMFHQGDVRFQTNTGNKLICFATYMG
jgi:hypothetical protein